MHAVLMDILGLGVLITGESGIGKSECALDLIVRGHRLVADDTVEVRRRAETVLIGTCPELTRHHMELRGLGLINIRELFGIASVRASKRVEFVVQLERWEPGRAYERLGLDDAFDDILGVQVPLVRMPVAPGRSVATLVEVAARNQLLRIARPPRRARAGRSGSSDQLREPATASRRRRPTRTTTHWRRTGWAADRQRAAARRAAPPGRPPAPGARFVVITGLSGSGKSQAIRALEDLGLLLRRQPADHADPDAGAAVAAAGHRAAEGGHRRGRARGRVPRAVPEGAGAT